MKEQNKKSKEDLLNEVIETLRIESEMADILGNEELKRKWNKVTNNIMIYLVQMTQENVKTMQQNLILHREVQLLQSKLKNQQ